MRSGAWLMQVAKNRALKRIERQKRWEARAELERAASFTKNARERALLLKRAAT